MSRRNYHELSPYDFECLVRDLLSAEWSERLESFPPGADSGIDVRLLRSLQDIEIVVQCKHSPGKSWSGVSSMLSEEAKKIKSKKWKEYWLATSASLSPQAKDKAAKLFSAQNLLAEHVLAAPDIDTLLNRHPDVERSNYKLYLTSVAVLEMLLHNDLFVHAQDLVQGIEERRKYYVQGRSLAEAQKVLVENRLCIISGPPGVGKTTLAEMLALNLVEEGYRPIWISEDPREADMLWRSGEKQFFLYDDFLGKNTLVDKMGFKGDARLMALIERVKSSSNHYLIMTTREYILAAARQTYELLREPVIDYTKLIVDLSSYTKFHKAHILYNHVYFSELNGEARAALRDERSYRAIVDHRNYNPRLIRLVIDSAVRTGGETAASGFPKFMLESLSDPSALWEHIFTQQLTSMARDMLIVLLSTGSFTDFSVFKAAVRDYRVVARSEPFIMEEFQNALSILDGVFIVVSMRSERRFVSFANPGIVDYLTKYLRVNPYIYELLAKSANLPEQVVTLWDYVNSDKGTPGKLFLPEVRTEFRLAPQLLLEAALRAMDKVQWTRAGGFVSANPLLQVDSAERMAVVAFAIVQSHLPHMIDVVSARIVACLQPRWESKIGNKHWALMLLHQLAPRLIHESGTSSFSVVARGWFSATLHGPEDYLKLRDLDDATRRNEEDFDEDELRREFLDYARSELETLVDTYDVDDVTSQLSTLKDALDEFDTHGVLDEQISTVESHIEYLESQSPDEEEADDWRGEASDDGGDIDDLFSMLE